MEKKRKFKMHSETQPKNKTFKANPIQLKDSFSKTVPLGIKCLICCTEIPPRPKTKILQDQVSTARLLGELLKVLKLSPQVCQSLLEKSFSTATVIYCETCEEAISSCLNIAQEIDNLQTEWEQISNIIKEKIIEDHQNGPDSDSCGNAYIRKTLVPYFDRPVTANQKKNDDKDDEKGLISQMALRPRPRPCQEQIVNYFCDVNIEENISESGSEYAPDSPFEEEKIINSDQPEPSLHEKPQSSETKLNENPKSSATKLNEKPQSSATKLNEKPQSSATKLIKTRKTMKKPTATATGLSKKPIKENSKFNSSKPKPGPRRKPTPTVTVTGGVAASSTSKSPPNSNPIVVEPPLHGCKICRLTFEDITTLRNHQMLSHHEQLEKDISCPECPEKFKNINTARDHQIRVHGKSLQTTLDADGNLDSFMCVYCNEEFVKSSFIVEDNSTDPPTKKLLEDFNSFHWNHRLFCKSRPRFALVADNLDVSYSVKHACQFCGKEFLSAIAARNHEITVHTKDFKCYCEVCGLPFPSKGVLNAHHQRAHRENQFKCELCPKTFKTNYQLKNHINTHNNIRSFVCEACGKAFCTKNVLWMHKKQSKKCN